MQASSAIPNYKLSMITLRILHNINDESSNNDTDWLTTLAALLLVLFDQPMRLIYCTCFFSRQMIRLVLDVFLTFPSKRVNDGTGFFLYTKYQKFQIWFTEFHVRIPSHHHNRTSRPAVHIWVIALSASKREWRMFRRRVDDDDRHHHHSGWDLSLPCHHQPPCDSHTHTHTHIRPYIHTHINSRGALDRRMHKPNYRLICDVMAKWGWGLEGS